MLGSFDEIGHAGLTTIVLYPLFVTCAVEVYRDVSAPLELRLARQVVASSYPLPPRELSDCHTQHP